MSSTPPRGYVAIVLHAHLPYVRHPEHPRSLEERWLFEAIGETYLPLLDVLDRLAADGIPANLTLSVSPPLAAMLRDPWLGARFEEHLGRLTALAARVEARCAEGPFAPAAVFYGERLAEVRAAWERRGGDVLGALVRHAAAGHLELCTTAASHAFLPGLLPAPGSIRAQLRLGRRAFAALSGAPPPAGFWLPECGFDPRLDAELAAAGVRYTVVDAHALAEAPAISPAGVVYFARDAVSVREVWSRDVGYPGHPAYREFYRDAGFEMPEDVLEDEIGPEGIRLMTGLKLHRVTGPGPDKAPYDPAAAARQARADADAFVARRQAHLAGAPGASGAGGRAPILVAAYDAELFGHWWLEGPEFLECAIRGLFEAARAGSAAPITLGAYLDRHGPAVAAQPAASTWGEGGWGAAWIGPRTARLWRHVHHADRQVQAALVRNRGQGGGAGRALDQAIRELVLLEASDWAFMMDRGEMVAYAEARVRAHAERVRRLTELYRGGPRDAAASAWLEGVCAQDRFLSELSGDAIQDAFDPWT